MLSEVIWDHYRHPRNRGALQPPYAEGWAGNRGRYMRLQIRIQDNHITAASFQALACVPCIACGSYLTEWLQNRTLDQLNDMTAPRLINELGGLPPDKEVCAQLALHALARALEAAASSGETHAT